MAEEVMGAMMSEGVRMMREVTRMAGMRRNGLKARETIHGDYWGLEATMYIASPGSKVASPMGGKRGIGS